MPARSWDRGAHCFVKRFMLGLDVAAAFFGGSITGHQPAGGLYERIVYAVHSGQFADSEARPVVTPSQDEGMPSRTT